MNSSRLLSLAAFVLLFAGQSVAVVAAAAAAAAAVPAAAAPGAASRNLPSSTSPPPPPSIITTTNRANTHPAFVASLQLGQAQQRLLSGPPSSSRWTSSSASVSASKKSGYSQRAGAGLGDDGVAVKAAAEPQEPEGPTLGFVGAGMMATAMINGIIASKVTKPENIVVSAAHQASLDKLKPTGVRTSESNAEVAAGSDVVILAVKPDILPSVLREIEPQLSDDALVMSIAAGIQLPVLEKLVPGKRVVRVMPNTPCLVSEGACGFSLGAHATDKDREVAHSLLGAVGYACEVKEPLLDALTGVSGSGPAYIFVLIEALADGGVRMGLPRDLAIKLAAQTVKGAAAMVLETGEHPAVLKDQVCSPGGLTIAAIESLEKDGFRAAAMSAVITVASKSIEMREGGIK